MFIYKNGLHFSTDLLGLILLKLFYVMQGTPHCMKGGVRDENTKRNF